MSLEKYLKKKKIEIQEHPADVIDVDPEILKNMKKRLSETAHHVKEEFDPAAEWGHSYKGHWKGKK